jgi:mono/diheme cytochrome c family protein
MTAAARSLRPTVLAAAGIACLLVLDVSVAIARQGSSANGPSRFGALARVPDKARAKRNPLERDPDAAAAGEKLFEQHCAECHGMKAEGTKKAPSLLNQQLQQVSPGAIFWIVTNGVVRRGMPVWSKLPEPERWQIVTFLRSLGPRQRQ